MCVSSSGPSAPQPIPPPQVADFFKQSRRRLPAPGTNPSIATSPLGLTTQATTAQKTLLGQ